MSSTGDGGDSATPSVLALYPNITTADQNEGHSPSSSSSASASASLPVEDVLEEHTPLQWPGASNVDELFVRQLITQLLIASYRPPNLLARFALPPNTMMKLLRQVALTFSSESNVVDVIVPHEGCVHVFGDIHGDVHSLANALNQTGLPSATNVLVFAGDYVDRGPWGVEVLAIILAMKVNHPNYVFILRGNHETSGCIQRYGFQDEVKYKYGPKMVFSFVNVFRHIPLIAAIRTLSPPSSTDPSKSNTNSPKKGKRRQTRASSRQQNRPVSHAQQSAAAQFPWSGPCQPGERRTVVMHGGLFRSQAGRDVGRYHIAQLLDIMYVSRRSDDPYGDMVEDVIWSDPQLNENGVKNNPFRGCGILFGKTALDFFFKKNGIHGMIRAHEGPDMRERRPEMQHMQDGFSIDMEVPSGYLVTLFSAADYPAQDPRGNKGAFATLYGKGHQQSSIMPKFTSFERKHPPANPHLFYTGAAGCCTPRASVS